MHTRLLACLLSFMLPALCAASLRPSDVFIKVQCAPGDTAPRCEVRVTETAGVCTIAAWLTNDSPTDVSLKNISMNFPWQKNAFADALLATGGWDMGRTELQVRKALGDEAIPTGSYMMLRDGARYSLAGFVSWRVFNSKMRYDAATGKIIVAADGENRLLKPGESVALEKIQLGTGADWQDLAFTYAAAVAKENNIKLNKPKPYVGWATWDYFGRNWTYQNVIDNMNALLEISPKADFLQIDGGWWPQRGDYLEVRADLQPDGMKRLADAMHSKKLTAGIHFDGMRGDSKAKVAKEHPDYFLKDQRGAMLVNATLNVGENLDYTFFDFSNPAACDYIENVSRNIRANWGYDYLKVDFLRFGVNEFIKQVIKDKSLVITPHDKSTTSFERVHRGLAAMRKGMGADAYFVGCSAVFGPTYGHVDGLRAGADIMPNFRQFKRCALDTGGNFHLHGTVVYNDADYHVARAKEDQDSSLVKAKNKDGGAMTMNEAEMWTHYVALFGGPKLNSDNLPILREERRALFRLAASIPTSERYVPLDLWEHGSNIDDPFGVVLGKHGSDVYLGVFNWTEKDSVFRLSGFTPQQLAALKTLGGSGKTGTSAGAFTVALPARHSMIFKLERADYDALRKTIKVSR